MGPQGTSHIGEGLIRAWSRRWAHGRPTPADDLRDEVAWDQGVGAEAHRCDRGTLRTERPVHAGGLNLAVHHRQQRRRGRREGPDLCWRPRGLIRGAGSPADDKLWVGTARRPGTQAHALARPRQRGPGRLHQQGNRRALATYASRLRPVVAVVERLAPRVVGVVAAVVSAMGRRSLSARGRGPRRYVAMVVGAQADPCQLGRQKRRDTEGGQGPMHASRIIHGGRGAANLAGRPQVRCLLVPGARSRNGGAWLVRTLAPPRGGLPSRR